ncbi:aldo/keto reductase [Aquimarina celericrescens]|uniref:Aldo/keto reductase n=1 Tax=Aquimarina celericrescens TaxID=1964542 RepID=A0ABW5B1J3_9FLAO|nr:aldo/keto reductase [Aquimarina celericrescens]
MSKNDSIIGLGTAAIGRPQYINIRQEASDQISLEDFRQLGRSTLEYAYQQGIRYFDTAPGYGLAEELLIDWVKTKNDPTIQIATKWGYTYTANFDLEAKQHEVKEHSLSKLNEQWQKSKELLSNLTIYQIHSATFESGVLENEAVLQKLLELRKEYNIDIGITTTGSNQVEVLKKALDIEVESHSLFEAFQVTYNVKDQNTFEMIKTLKNQAKKVIIKEALANGRLFPNKKYRHYQKLYSFMGQLANKYNVGIDAIALRFCIDTVEPFKILSGASDKIQIIDNLKTLTFQLEDEEIELLKSFRINPENYWSERKRLPWN